MLRKIFSITLVFVFALTLTACGGKYRVAREGMPEGLKVKLEEQIVNGEKMLAAAQDDDAKEKALLEIAFGNEQLGYFDKAIPAYKDILKANPVHFPALNNLGVIYEEVGEYVTAAKYYGKLLDANPSNTEALSDAIRALLEAGHFEDAQTTLTNFTVYNKDNVTSELQTFISNQFQSIMDAKTKAQAQNAK